MKRGNKMKHLGALLLMTGGLLLSACGLSSLPDMSETAQSSDSKPETAAPDESSDSASASEFESDFPDLLSFEAKTIDGSSFTPADFAGADVTAINIWSTTCGPCVREMPELAEYAKSLPENLNIMTWCLDADISASGSEIGKFMNECGFTGITLASGDGDLQKLYGQLLYTPTTIFVDATGKQVAEPLIGAGNIAERYSAQFEAALKILGIESTLQKEE